jgi:hypothetical protein
MSAKGLEWARRLRAELERRIDELSEALAGIEPLRRELARLEEQLDGVERLIAAYENQLGYPKPAEVAAPIAVQAASPQEEPLLPLADTAPVPVEPPTLVAILRAEALSVMAACRKGAVLLRDASARLWLSLRIWISERIRHRNAHS